ncbi:quinone oxidoreductase family protein [Streptomyces rubradiris]|uniref:NADPH:quinone reductase n=1 Tax=Streptomyces rubradiris TaxID=285531 RepID=A0ABQ3RA79_STRRR|nr:zinc-binding dehydrogenase [Streptomyces rubradiris]GHH25845.1 NADPH:quinone reductase [Streptomyces rubradiris]GHI52755.1 NADPH:quinone reductase [Streptomyces rubradiris]
MRAIVIREFGGPEALQLEDVPEPEPRRTETVLSVRLAGVNYADVHVRGNTYLAPVELPYIPGNEVVGTAGGRRVVALTQGGGYAERVAVRRSLQWEIPDDVTDEQAVPLALQGNSAYHLLLTVAQVTRGQTVVIPAAAGGVGSLAVQLAEQQGARAIALASTEEKRRLALDLGAVAAVDSSDEDGLTERILEAAGGPVDAALEMTGGQTLHQTLAAIRPRGRLAVYGFASGQLADIPVHTLLQKSITVGGFWLPHMYTDRTLPLTASMKTLFSCVASGRIKVISGGTFPLADAAKAHHALQSRTGTGKFCLDTTK